MSDIKLNFFSKIFLNISVFRVTYFFLLFMCSFFYADVFMNNIKPFFLLWGLYLIYIYQIKPRRYYRGMYFRWPAAFLFCGIVTACIHIADNFIPNMILLGHVAVCFFVFYSMHTERNRRRKARELYAVSLIILTATTAAMILSFVSLLFGEQNTEFFGNRYHMVIFENRFTGIFINPNLLAFYGVTAVFFADVLCKKDLYREGDIPKRLPKVFFIVCVVINIIGIFLSDSNGSLLLLACYAVGNLIYIIFGFFKRLSLKSLIVGVTAVLLAMVILTGALLGLRIFSNRAVSVALSAGNAVSQSEAINPYQKDGGDGHKDRDISVVTFAHENENLDSGRIELLKKAVVVFYNNPIFGVGKENILLYGERLMPKGFKYSDLHNGYLTILVSNGLVGFILFAVFAVSLGRDCLKSVFLEKKDLKRSPFLCMFAFTFAYALYSVVEKTVLLEQTYMVVTLWYVLGYLSCYMKKYDHSEEKISFASLFGNKENTDEKTEAVPEFDK